MLNTYLNMHKYSLIDTYNFSRWGIMIKKRKLLILSICLDLNEKSWFSFGHYKLRKNSNFLSNNTPIKLFVKEIRILRMTVS
jgi:hypothetical protein